MENIKRRTAAFALFLIWMIAFIVSFYLISETNFQNEKWLVAVFSLLLFMIGMVAFFEQIRVFLLLYPPAAIYSVKDTTKYNVEKASFVLGILTAILSYAILFMLTGYMISVVALLVTLVVFAIGVVFVFFSKKFRNDIRSEQ